MKSSQDFTLRLLPTSKGESKSPATLSGPPRMIRGRLAVTNANIRSDPVNLSERGVVTSTVKETTVQVAVVQAGAVPFDTEACVDKAVRLIGEAAATGAKVILFPEAFITGYPKGLNYGLVVGARDAAGREEFRLYLDAAIEVPGPQTQRLGEAAAAHGSYVVIGVIERELGTCYCTVLFFGPGRSAAREAPQAHADCLGADDLGFRRRFDADGGG